MCQDSSAGEGHLQHSCRVTNMLSYCSLQHFLETIIPVSIEMAYLSECDGAACSEHTYPRCYSSLGAAQAGFMCPTFRCLF